VALRDFDPLGVANNKALSPLFQGGGLPQTASRPHGVGGPKRRGLSPSDPVCARESTTVNKDRGLPVAEERRNKGAAGGQTIEWRLHLLDPI
jgi:hypothetical protein